MHLKIIDTHGQCRGRPPNVSNNRDGPYAVSGQWSAVTSWQPACRQGRFAVDSWQLALCHPEWRRRSREGSPLIYNTAVIARSESAGRRRATSDPPGWYAVRGSPPVIARSERQRMTSDLPWRQRMTSDLPWRQRMTSDPPGWHKPRDWPTFTCSVNWIITRDRDKDRWNASWRPAVLQRGGGAMQNSE
jgi:hypothetical protein